MKITFHHFRHQKGDNIMSKTMSKTMPKMSLVLPGEYCNECSLFKPEVVAEDLYADNRCIGNYRSIICQNEKTCRRIYEYLTKALEKQDDM